MGAVPSVNPKLRPYVDHCPRRFPGHCSVRLLSGSTVSYQVDGATPNNYRGLSRWSLTWSSRHGQADWMGPIFTLLSPCGNLSDCRRDLGRLFVVEATSGWGEDGVKIDTPVAL
ncbi:hypothetical protein B296_00038705 [Ensete ventricosum]|uniref:Uncharacterized protein n=1 Tax=Ensete ventricosum TaxID=4639 RepID=A0A426XGB3_ENSVE|nr:hypothetical protein B296_00038705 [Ensete ventricosum]